MQPSEIREYLAGFDGDDRIRAARHLIETNPALAAIYGEAQEKTTRHQRGGVKAMQPGYTGDGRDMKANGPSGVKPGWRYYDRGRVHPDTPELSKCDFKAPSSVGRFLPDAVGDEDWQAANRRFRRDQMNAVEAIGG